jgi:hypothetical protein
MTIIQRIKTKPGYKYLFLAIILVILIDAINNENKNYIKKLRNSTIECNIKGKGWTIIDSSKIVDFDDETGTIIFENGYAKNCIIENKD